MPTSKTIRNHPWYGKFTNKKYNIKTQPTDEVKKLFENPILHVDIPTGEILIDRLTEIRKNESIGKII